MRTVFLSLAIFAFVAAGIYSISWFIQAAQIKSATEQAIATLNAGQPVLTYESIETSGFPADVYVTLVKPHFLAYRCDLTSLQDTQRHLRESLGRRAAPLPEWTEDLALDGNIVLGINALSDRYSLRMNGNWRHSGTIAGQALVMTGRAAGETLCTLKLAHSGGLFASLWDFHALARDGRDFIKDLRLLDCANAGNTVADAAGQVLMSAGPARIYTVTSTPQGDREQLRVYLKVIDSEITAEGDKVVAAYVHAISPDYTLPIRYSVYGKQNAEVDFDYDGPANWETAHNPPLDIRLSKFEISSQVYAASGNLYLTNGMNESNRSARLAFKLDASTGEQYDLLMQDMTRNMVAQMYVEKDPRFADLQPSVKKYTPEQLYAILAPAVCACMRSGHMANLACSTSVSRVARAFHRQRHLVQCRNFRLALQHHRQRRGQTDAGPTPARG